MVTESTTYDSVDSTDQAHATETPAIRTLDLAKTYGSKTALAGFTLSVGRGEVFGFLGPNGAGKTTAVKLLVGLSAPTRGEAWVLGAPVGDLDTRRRLGYLPELFRYQDWLSAREVLDLHCRLARIPKSRRKLEIDEALDLSGLTNRADDRVGSFSKGMQQRLGLGVALLGSPEVVFLDEPTSALDPVGRHDVREIIRRLRARGATVFLNSHLLSEVEQVCDRVAIIDFGKVVMIGTLAELRGTVKGARVHASNVSFRALELLRSHCTVSLDGDWLTLSGLETERVPEIIRMLVAEGADIHAVQPAGSLEESFLALLHGGEHGHSDPGRPNAP